MLRFVLHRLVSSVVVLWAVASLVFVMIKLAPGDPAQLYLGIDATPRDIAALDHRLGLDRPLPVQYLLYMENLLRGDFGRSIFSDQPVSALVLERAPATVELALLTVVVSSGLGLLLGMVAASKQNSVRDGAVRIGTVVGISLPNFWLGLLLLLICGLWVPGILPPGGWVALDEDPAQNLYHLVLPVFVLSLPNLAIVSRTLRTSMLDALTRDYVTFARAMGMPGRRVHYAVALPNAIIPSATVIGLAVGYLIGGAVIVEVVFTIPGVGQLLVDSFLKRDFPVAIGATLFVAAAFVFTNLVVDLLYALFNPRIRELYRRTGRSADA